MFSSKNNLNTTVDMIEPEYTNKFKIAQLTNTKLELISTSDNNSQVFSYSWSSFAQFSV